MSRYIIFFTKLKRRGMPFWEGARRGGATLWDYLQEHLVVIKEEKACPFVKLEIILLLLCCSLEPLTNRRCRAWSSMINLWIDSRTCQKFRILLFASKGLTITYSFQKKMLSREYDVVTLTMLYLKVLHVLGSKSVKLWCQFWNYSSIPLQILHHSSLSWHITTL